MKITPIQLVKIIGSGYEKLHIRGYHSQLSSGDQLTSQQATDEKRRATETVIDPGAYQTVSKPRL